MAPTASSATAHHDRRVQCLIGSFRSKPSLYAALSLLFTPIVYAALLHALQGNGTDFHTIASLSIGSLVPMEPLNITTPSLPAGLVGAAYGPAQISVTGALPPMTLSISDGSLPAGIDMSVSGVLSGVPTSFGNATFTVTVR